MRGVGLVPDPWQAEVLDARHSRVLLNCARQAAMHRRFCLAWVEAQGSGTTHTRKKQR
jgi:hypothetical protein